MILAQAPVGAAQGPAGPDAVATNLVNTVCASCHTLDRVKNKVADKDGWTTTVTRMKEKGTARNDQQVPVVVEYLTRAAGLECLHDGPFSLRIPQILHDRRRLAHFNVTAHPTAEWTSRQILEAFRTEVSPASVAIPQSPAQQQAESGLTGLVSDGAHAGYFPLLDSADGR